MECPYPFALEPDFDRTGELFIDITFYTREQDRCLLFPILDLHIVNNEGTLLKLELF